MKQFGVGNAGAVGERLTEKADAEVAVFEFGVGRKGDAVVGDFGVEKLGAVVGVGVIGVGGREVAGHARKTGVLIAEVEESDLGAVGLGDGVGWEQVADGSVEADFLLLDHLREDECGEGLGDGADFEDGVRLGGAVGEDVADAVLDDTDGDAGVRRGSECAVLEGGGKVAVEDGLEVVGGDGREGWVTWRSRRHGRCERRCLAGEGERKVTALMPGAVERVGGEAAVEVALDGGDVDGDGVDRGGDGAGDAHRALIERVGSAGPLVGGFLMEVELDAKGVTAGGQRAEPDAVEG